MKAIRILNRLLIYGLTISSSWASSEMALNDSKGFSVNRFSKNQVVSFWHRYYLASEGYEDRWAGEVDFINCTLSAPPVEFTKDVQRRVNYYRAMVGLPANAMFEDAEVFVEEEDAFIPTANTTKAEAARAAALSLASQGYDIQNPSAFVLKHNLDDTFGCFSAPAWNGAKNSNLAGLLWGPDAVDGYMEEFGTVDDPLSNKFVGHRRWLLFSAVGKMATGDVPPSFEDGKLVRAAVNALYVVGDYQKRELQFVAWPNDGFVPAPLVPELWSLSYPGADFSQAEITMKGPEGQSIPLVVVSRSLGVPRADQPPLAIEEPLMQEQELMKSAIFKPLSILSSEEDTNGLIGPSLPSIRLPQVKNNVGPGAGNYADSTIVWLPSNLPEIFSDNSEYEVTVSNIIDAPQDDFTYKVTMIDPNVLQPLELVGTEAPPVIGANYYFAGAEYVDEFEFEVSQRDSFEKVEDAEGELNVIDNSANGVALIDSFTAVSDDEIGLNRNMFLGTKAFRLAFADINVNPPLACGFEIDEDFDTQPGSKMTFQFRRGFMSTTTHLDVEFSTDGGVSWQASGTRITGKNGIADAEFEELTVDLIESSSVRIRFQQTYEPDGITGWYAVSSSPTSPFGIYLDDITFSNVEIAISPITIGVSGDAKQVEFTESSLGEPIRANEVYNIRIRPLIAGFSFAWSPVKEITVQPFSALTGYDRWAELSFPTAGDFTDDFDGDGLIDGHEYALGTSPIDGSNGFSSMALTQDGGLLCLTAPGSGLKPDISYKAEWTTDLKNWSSNGVTVSDNEGKIKALAPAGVSPKAYMRWVISNQ